MGSLAGLLDLHYPDSKASILVQASVIRQRKGRAQGDERELIWQRVRGEVCCMQFSEQERQAMLALKGVGATVITRLEQVGYSALRDLRDQDAAKVTQEIAAMMGSTCWHNSPQARASIQAVIDLAKSAVKGDV